MNKDIGKRLVAEFIGTGFLLVAIVGSGIMAIQLTDDVALQLLINSLATGFALVALISALGAVSGAHFNPLVTLLARTEGLIGNSDAIGHVAAQVAGAVVGTIVANVMFSEQAIMLGTTVRSGTDLWLSEAVATFGLLLVVAGVVRVRPESVPIAVGFYVAGAILFTSSTSFANPAVTLGRALTDTFAGIAPASVPAFIIAELVGAGAAVALVRFIYPGREATESP